MAFTLHSSTPFLNNNINHSNITDLLSSTSSAFFPHISNTPTRQRRSIVAATTSNDSSVIVIDVVTKSTTKREKLHAQSTSGPHGKGKVPVYVMLPLDAGMKGNKARAMNASLMALKGAGAEGVMVDVWWGLVEREGPLKYNWEAYADLVRMVQRHGLKLQVVMSFHQCGGNVGDSCSIPLPPWVLESISKNPDLVYTDKSGRRNPEYISLGCDSLPVLRGRTPIQVYSDFMRSFRDRFADYLGNTIVEIQVGMGPCGELRYPAYPEANGTWNFPGIGEFQCYDKYMRASLAASALAIGKKDWGTSGPHDAGSYNHRPEDTGFFRREGTWNTDYGRFFLEWYSGSLLRHGDALLSAAEAIFSGTGAKLSGKVAGIHWHYNTRSHAAELTAGYNNPRGGDGYGPIARVFARHGAAFNFTCMEMRDGEQPREAGCSPEGLVAQATEAAAAAGVGLAGENALERYDAAAFAQVVEASRRGGGLCAFTYLRMNKRLFEGENWRNLVEFVRAMSSECGDDQGRRSRRLYELDSAGMMSDLYVGFVKKREEKLVALVL